MRRRYVHSLFTVAALACTAAVAYEALELARAQRINAAIASALVNPVASASTGALDPAVPEARFARAIALDKAGDYEGSMLAYKAVVQSSRPDLRQLALYNLGNLHMRAALKENSVDAEQVLPLVELAKQSYRDLLREWPGDWDTRYNLERALYLAPEGSEDLADDEPPSPKERSISTNRAKLDLP
jgi:mxaK protein